MLAQPDTVAPSSLVSSTQMMPMKLARLMKKPSPVMRRMGFTERLVMPSKAKFSIFFSG